MRGSKHNFFKSRMLAVIFLFLNAVSIASPVIKNTADDNKPIISLTVGYAANAFESEENQTPNSSFINHYSRSSVTLKNHICTKKDFSHLQHLTVMGGITYQTYMTRSTDISVSGFANNITENYNLGSAEIISPPSSSISQWNLVSGLGRVNYSFGEKYFLRAFVQNSPAIAS